MTPLAKRTNAERFLERTDLITILAFVDRLSAREILLTFRGNSTEDTFAQQQGWIRWILSPVDDLIAEHKAWTDPDPPYESHMLLQLAGDS